VPRKNPGAGRPFLIADGFLHSQHLARFIDKRDDPALVVLDFAWFEAHYVKSTCGQTSERISPFRQGTGQGLAIAHTMIVQKRGGTISLDTAMGISSTFKVR
jgi:signal transduction histidine kinase